jgi:hypothetical protein
MPDITTIGSGAASYPAVQALRDLAGISRGCPVDPLASEEVVEIHRATAV